MNRHYEDAWYHVKRAGEHAWAGTRETLWPVEQRVREATGRELEEEPSRVDRARVRIERVEERAGRQAREAYDRARRFRAAR